MDKMLFWNELQDGRKVKIIRCELDIPLYPLLKGEAGGCLKGEILSRNYSLGTTPTR